VVGCRSSPVTITDIYIHIKTAIYLGIHLGIRIDDETKSTGVRTSADGDPPFFPPHQRTNTLLTWTGRWTGGWTGSEV
jgi:hypothetical protein